MEQVFIRAPDGRLPADAAKPERVVHRSRRRQITSDRAGNHKIRACMFSTTFLFILKRLQYLIFSGNVHSKSFIRSLQPGRLRISVQRCHKNAELPCLFYGMERFLSRSDQYCFLMLCHPLPLLQLFPASLFRRFRQVHSRLKYSMNFFVDFCCISTSFFSSSLKRS